MTITDRREFNCCRCENTQRLPYAKRPLHSNEHFTAFAIYKTKILRINNKCSVTQIKLNNVRDVFSFRQNFPYWNESKEDAGRQVLRAGREGVICANTKKSTFAMSFGDSLASETISCGVLVVGHQLLRYKNVETIC